MNVKKIYIYNLHIIYYVYVTNQLNWRCIVKGQIEDIIYSNLLQFSYLHICLSGDYDVIIDAKSMIQDMLSFEKKTLVEFIIEEKNLYEYPGIHTLYKIAKENPDHIFFYMHSKGVSHDNISENRSNINIYLTRMTLWNYSKVKKIFNNRPQINKIGLFPSTKGWIWYNFFWVRGSYLVSCYEPVISSKRHYYESWLGISGKNGCSDCYSLFNNKNGAHFTPKVSGKNLHLLYEKYKFLVINNKVYKIHFCTDKQYIDITKTFMDLLCKNNLIKVDVSLLENTPYEGVFTHIIIKLEDKSLLSFKKNEFIFSNTIAQV